jgi:uncharacterized membrane protein
MGYGLCHQLPQRSFFGGGVQVPVCARDTGIYLGFALSFAILAIIHSGQRPRGFPTTPAWILMGLFLAVMGWDGVSSYAGLRTTTNDLRLITGLGVGFSAAAVVYPMLQDELWRQQTQDRVLSPLWRLLVWLSCIPLSFLFIRFVAPSLGVAYPVVVAGGILVTLTSINLVMVAMLPAFDRRGEGLRDVVLPLGIAFAGAVAEIVGSGYLRLVLERLVGRLG